MMDRISIPAGFAPPFLWCYEMTLKTAKPSNNETTFSALQIISTLLLSRYIALSDGRHPGVAVKATAKKLYGRVKYYPAFNMLLKKIYTSEPGEALASVIRTENDLRKKGLI